jgi:hypothetical protein
MNPVIFRTSLSDSLYFSSASFIVMFAANWLYGLLQKTPGRLNIGPVLVIVLSLILIMFILAITNIALVAHEKAKIKFGERILAIFLFILTSAVILGILGFLFWFEF